MGHSPEYTSEQKQPSNKYTFLFLCFLFLLNYLGCNYLSGVYCVFHPITLQKYLIESEVYSQFPFISPTLPAIATIALKQPKNDIHEIKAQYWECDQTMNIKQKYMETTLQQRN